MKAEDQSDAPVFKSVPYHDPSANFRLEVQGATKTGGLHSDLYRAEDSQHLPAVILTQLGASASIEITGGNSFSASMTAPDQAVIKQFDAKTGKLLSEDDLEIDSDYHIKFDPNTGKRTHGAFKFSSGLSDASGTADAVDKYMSYRDTYDKNGVLRARDFDSKHIDFDAQGKQVKSIEISKGGAPGEQTVEAEFDGPDGTWMSVTTHVGKDGATVAEGPRPGGRYARVSFDARTGRPDAVEEIIPDGNHEYFRIDEKTGKATPDFWENLNFWIMTHTHTLPG